MKTAMQELIDWAISLQYNQQQCTDWIVIKDKAESLLEMEREQHGKTWDGALDAGQSRAWNVMRAYSDFDDYYYETYVSGMSEKPNDHIVEANEMVSPQTEISDEQWKKIVKEMGKQPMTFVPNEISDEEITYTEEQLKLAYMQGYNRGVLGTGDDMESYIEFIKQK